MIVGLDKKTRHSKTYLHWENIAISRGDKRGMKATDQLPAPVNQADIDIERAGRPRQTRFTLLLARRLRT